MQPKGKVLVTGANGLLGSNVVTQLLKAGYEVKTIVRKGSNLAALKGILCEIFEGKLTSFTDMENAVTGCDYVVHCAANTEQKSNQSDAFKKINVDATATLIELSKPYKIKRFIFVSTANCFTNGTLQNPGDESKEFMPWLIKSGYAYSKYLAQKMVLNEAKENGFPAIVVAPTFIIGPRDAKISSGKLLMHGLNKRIVFYPPGGKSIVDAEFAAEAVVNSLHRGTIGETYLLSGENLSYKQLFKKISRHSNKKAIFIQIPGWFLVLLANFFSFIEKVFCIPLSLNKTNQRLLCLDNYFSNKKAVTHLGLKETDADDAIEKAIYWFKKNGYL
jgi:dihydroflavonol-4-reductase